MKTVKMIAASSLLFTSGLFLWSMNVTAQQPKPTRPFEKGDPLSKEDETAIRKVFSDYEAAWNSHNMKSLTKLFRDDAEAINVVGMYWRGIAAIEKSHTVYHEILFKNHNIKTDDVQIRSLGHGHVIAVVTTTNDAFTTPDGHTMTKAQNRQTFVLTKGDDGWKVSHFHNVRVDADAAKHDPVNSPKK
jgi:uncharacterized protein (TIGR02246 family)